MLRQSPPFDEPWAGLVLCHACSVLRCLQVQLVWPAGDVKYRSGIHSLQELGHVQLQRQLSSLLLRCCSPLPQPCFHLVANPALMLCQSCTFGTVNSKVRQLSSKTTCEKGTGGSTHCTTICQALHVRVANQNCLFLRKTSSTACAMSYSVSDMSSSSPSSYLICRVHSVASWCRCSKIAYRTVSISAARRTWKGLSGHKVVLKCIILPLNLQFHPGKCFETNRPTRSCCSCRYR